MATPSTEGGVPTCSTAQPSESTLHAEIETGRSREPDRDIPTIASSASYPANGPPTTDGRRGFLDLPREIRQKIYRYAFQGVTATRARHENGVLGFRDNSDLVRRMAIFFTCQTIHTELPSIVAQATRLSFHPPSMKDTTIPPVLAASYLPFVRHVRLLDCNEEFNTGMFPNLKELHFCDMLEPWNEPYLEYVKLEEPFDDDEDQFSRFLPDLEGENDQDYVDEWMKGFLELSADTALISGGDPGGVYDDGGLSLGGVRLWRKLSCHDQRKFSLTTALKVEFFLDLDCGSHNKFMHINLNIYFDMDNRKIIVRRLCEEDPEVKCTDVVSMSHLQPGEVRVHAFGSCDGVDINTDIEGYLSARFRGWPELPYEEGDLWKDWELH